MNGSGSEDWLALLEVFGMNQLSMQGHPIHIKVTTPAQLMQGQGVEDQHQQNTSWEICD